VKRRVLAPLLLTRCDLCRRRRTCAPIVGRRWLCRLCAVRVYHGCLHVLAVFHARGFGVGVAR